MQEKNLEWYKNFYEQAPVGFYITSIADGTFLKANVFCIKMMGCNTFEELQNNVKTSDLYPLRQRKQLIKEIYQNGRVTNFEICLNLKDLNKKWVVVTAQLSEDEKYIEGSITDITTTKILENKLKKYKLKNIKEIDKLNEKINNKLKEYKF